MFVLWRKNSIGNLDHWRKIHIPGPGNPSTIISLNKNQEANLQVHMGWKERNPIVPNDTTKSRERLRLGVRDLPIITRSVFVKRASNFEIRITQSFPNGFKRGTLGTWP